MKKYNFLIIGCLMMFINKTPVLTQDSLLLHNEQRIFLSGMNLAWINFANDLATFDEETFITAMDGIAEAGGNAVRWWLHTNGRNSPIFTSGVVSGIDPVEITNLQRALDLAYERGILLVLCLWSFDMMQDNALPQNWPRNRSLLENSASTQAYIDNALIPLVEGVKGHPGILCWEIFNEPEGMITGYGWTPERIDFIHVQRFVNRTTGAIHRADPDAKVSNGSWNIRVMSDIGTFHNYYRDDRLITAGGDTLGTLDFYMVHYYPVHFPISQSPFHNHASHWELDKPIVIGEFPSLGINRPPNSKNTVEAYEYAIQNGYSGALSWTWTGHDGNGGLPESTEAMLNLQDKYPELINLVPDPNFHYPPHVEQQIPGFFQKMLENQPDTFSITDLTEVFGSRNEGMELSFSIQSNSNPELAEAYIDSVNILNVILFPEIQGFCNVMVLATDTGGKTVTTPLNISVYDPASEDRLLNRRAFSSSIENTGHLPFFAVDGNATTRWSSQYAHDEWLAVEMDTIYSLEQVMLHWEAAFGKEYSIQVSDNGNEWNTVFHEACGNGGYDRIIFDPVEAKFIRMHGITRGTQWGFSLWAFEAYSDVSENSAPVFIGEIPNQLIYAETLYSYSIPLNIVEDDDVGERLFFFVDQADTDSLPHWLSFDECTRTLEGNPDFSDIGEYQFKVTVKDMFDEADELFFALTVEELPTNILKTFPAFAHFKVYPNPATDFINLSIKQDGISKLVIRIHDISGREVFNNRYDNLYSGEFNGVIDIQHLTPGFYKLSAISGEHQANVKLLVE